MDLTKRIFRNKFESAVCERCGQSIAIGHPISWQRRQHGERKSHVWHAPSCPGTAGYRDTSSLSDAEIGLNTQSEINNANETMANELEGQSQGQMQGYEETSANGSSKPQVDSDALDVLRSLGKVLDPFMGPKQAPIDEKTVERIVTRTLTKDLDMHIDEALKGKLFQTVQTVKLQDAKTNETKDLGLQHKQFPKLLELASCRVDVWLPGPAGSGKTTAAENVAKALGLKFYHVGAMDSDYKLMGFVDAQGRIVHTLFREWFINGGVICLDEVDSWLPSATLALNASLANGHCTFPDGMFQRHPDSVVIACANTFGLGDSTTDYTGRMKQDAAFLDRFVQLAWEYDESFELALVIATHGAELANKWVPRVQAIRAKCKAQGLRVVISPRASIKGALLLAHGMEQAFVEQVTLRKGMSEAQWTNVR